MKKYLNGKIVKMTTDEIAAFEAQAKKMQEILAMQPPTAEERLEALEAAFIELVGVMYND